MLILSRSVKVYLFLICVFFIYRLGFSFYFSEFSFLKNNYPEVLKAFFMGWRYDTIVSCYVLVPFLIWSLLNKINPINWTKPIVGFVSYLYLVFFIFLITIFLMSDLGFYSYFQDHINILIFGLIEDDTRAVINSVEKNYPLKLIVSFAFIYLLFIFYFVGKVFQKKRLNISVPLQFLYSILFLFLLVGGLRGGYTIFVLSPKYADFSKHQIINDMSINGIITFEKAYKLRRSRTSLDFDMAKSMGYGEKVQNAFSDYLGFDVSFTPKEQLLKLIERKTALNDKLDRVKPNVVVLVMESFGGHWMQFNSKEFNFLGNLDKHFKEDYLFKNIISGDNGTIGSLMVLGTNIPHRNGARFISESRYLRAPLSSAAHNPFLKRGYDTSFLYGGKLSWRDIGRYFKTQGFHSVEGESHIKGSLGLIGKSGTEWGVFDEHLFDHIYRKLENGSNPKFMMALSTTNHPPFEVPSNYQALPLNLPENLKGKITREKDLFMKRFLAFQYANRKLEEFISKVKKSSFGQNTIIAVTGDHNFWGFMNYAKEDSYRKYSVPLYFYIPESLRPVKYDEKLIGGHEDVMTTLYNLALSHTSFYAFGDDLFNIKSQKSNALGASIYASSEGGFYEGIPFLFDDGDVVVDETARKKLTYLKRQYRSTLTIADFLLRSEYNKRLNNESVTKE